MAKTLSRSTASRVANRFFSTSIAADPSPLPSQCNLISHRSSPTLFHAVPSSTPLTEILQTQMIRPRKSRSKFGDRPPTEMAPLPSGCDYKHWLIVIDKPGGENANKEQMIDWYVQTLAKIVGIEEEAKRKIYNVSCEKCFSFGCEIDEETSNRLKDIPGVLYVLPDSYVDPEYKDYGGELFVNGEVVPRPPGRQRRIVEFTTRNPIERPPTEKAPLPSGCDYKHWLIVIDKPGGEYANKEQMIDCYVQTLAKIVGSEEEGKRKIYNVSCEKYFAFGCEIDEETSNRLKGIPGVLYVLPDSYVDPEFKDSGGELFVNGEVVARHPVRRQRRIVRFTTPISMLRYSDRTRNVRGRENML